MVGDCCNSKFSSATKHIVHRLFKCCGVGTSCPFSSIVMVFEPKAVHMTIGVPSSEFAQSGVMFAIKDMVIAQIARTVHNLLYERDAFMVVYFKSLEFEMLKGRHLQQRFHHF